ncbi:reverse transcriptase domain-containing protein [Tanacetum coccineum]
MQQPPHKRKNVVRAFTAGADKKKEYAGNFPYCNKCRLHHAGPCTLKCNNRKRVGHMKKRCRTSVSAITQMAPIANQKPKVTCYEYEKPGHFRSDCPKLKNQNQVNQIWKEKAYENTSIVADNANA